MLHQFLDSNIFIAMSMLLVAFLILANVDMFYSGPILYMIQNKKHCVNKKQSHEL